MRVALFVTCLIDVFFPEVAKSAVRVLRRHGVEVDVPLTQTCCGQPAYNSGYREEAREVAKQLIRAFEGSTYVVTPSGSCAAMIRCEYPRLFAGDPVWRPRAEALAAKTYEFSEFLVRVLGVEDPGVTFPARATVHASCHMTRGLGVSEEPMCLLKRVKGLELRPLPNREDCCGFGGTFAVKMADISAAMADEKIDHIEETEADVLIGSDMGCLWHLGGRLSRRGKPLRVLHVAQILDGGRE